MAKYKAEVNRKRHPLEFKEGDFVWAVLTKDQFAFGEYNKLVALKISQVKIVKKINPNVYKLKFPSHIKTSDVFNVKHLVPFIEDSSEEDANYVQTGEDDIDQDAWEYMRKKRKDVKVEPPQRMVTRSQTRVAAEESSIKHIRSILFIRAIDESDQAHDRAHLLDPLC
jgi:hypothetical protein